MRGCGKWLVIVFVAVAVVSSAAGEKPVKSDKDEVRWAVKRSAMVDTIRRYGVKDLSVLQAVGKIKRHKFVPDAVQKTYAVDPYADRPCPIGHGQTMSQPFIVAYMTEQLGVVKGEKVLEIGTGSGYQAAVLAELGAEVYSIEIIPELAEHARNVLKREGYEAVKVLTGDGYKGWEKHAPYDAIIVTCAPSDVPEALVAQLKDNGRMIIPVGTLKQKLVMMRKKDGEMKRESDIPVRFVPMVKGKK